MLPATRRLKKDRDFRRVLESGQKRLFDPLLIFTAPAATDHGRFGVVVSKKVSKLAVRRNQIRRQLSHLLKPIAAPFNSPQDVVVVVVRSAEQAEYQRALEQWQKRA